MMTLAPVAGRALRFELFAQPLEAVPEPGRTCERFGVADVIRLTGGGTSHRWIAAVLVDQAPDGRWMWSTEISPRNGVGLGYWPSETMGNFAPSKADALALGALDLDRLASRALAPQDLARVRRWTADTLASTERTIPAADLALLQALREEGGA